MSAVRLGKRITTRGPSGSVSSSTSARPRPPPWAGEARRWEAAAAAFVAFPNLRAIASTARHVDDAETHRISARLDLRDSSAQTREVVVAGIVDRIGAGDAFAAGILHGLRGGRDPDWTVHAGLALTALKHSLPGDVSLFGERDIEAFLTGELDVRR